MLLTDVHSRWRVMERLRIGEKNGKGEVVKASHLTVNRGDLVDVSLSIDIVRSRGGSLAVHFVPSVVVVLKKGMAKNVSVSHTSQSTCATAKFTSLRRRKRHIRIPRAEKKSCSPALCLTMTTRRTMMTRVRKTRRRRAKKMDVWREGVDERQHGGGRCAFRDGDVRYRLQKISAVLS